jgi:hypothetical protein
VKLNAPAANPSLSSDEWLRPQQPVSARALRAELQALRVELTERRHAELTAIREVLGESIDEVINQVVVLNKRLQTELWNLVTTRLGACCRSSSST